MRNQKGERPVVFLHVPEGTEEEDLVRGRKVVVALIRALVEGRGQQKGERERIGGGGLFINSVSEQLKRPVWFCLL